MADVDVKKIIKDLGSASFAGSNEEQMKMLQLMKGLATNDSKEANEFMSLIDKAATNAMKKVLGGEEKPVEEKKNMKESNGSNSVIERAASISW
jgi:hypothetical protein